MLDGVKLARRIGRNPALAQFLELEILPGDAVGDDQLADAIASNLASYGHPVATAPMGGPEDPWAVVDSHGAVKGSTDFASSTRRSCPSFHRWRSTPRRS